MGRSGSISWLLGLDAWLLGRDELGWVAWLGCLVVCCGAVSLGIALMMCEATVRLCPFRTCS